MATRITFALLIALALTACEREPVVADGNGSANAPPQTPAGDRIEEGALVYTLTGNGLEPGLAFGTPRDQAVATAEKAFGAPTGEEHNSECGEGPMDFVRFRDLSLGFQDGRLAGWLLRGRMPSLRTEGGIAIGAPKSALGQAAIDMESSLGPEFDVNGVGGLLDEKESEVVALWGGLACHFR